MMAVRLMFARGTGRDRRIDHAQVRDGAERAVLVDRGHRIAWRASPGRAARGGQLDRERCLLPRRLLAADAGHVEVYEHDLLHVVEFAGAGCGMAQDQLRERGLRVAAARLGDGQQPGDTVAGRGPRRRREGRHCARRLARPDGR